MTSTQVVVIGGGPGGYAAAFLAADLGLSTALVDTEPNPGGVCVYRGCIPSKALLHVAKLIDESRHAKAWGIEFGKHKVDLDMLRRKLEAIVGKLTKGVQTLAGSRKVEVIHARAMFTNATTLTLTGSDGSRELSFGHAIVASGSRPVIPASLKLEDPRVMDSTGALALPDVPARLLVVGGGYIGLELGTVYQALGSEVTVAEALPRLLNGVDPDLVKPLQQRLQRRFKAIRLNTKVDRLEAKKEGVAATLSVRDFTTGGYVFFVTRLGRVKKTELAAFSRPQRGGIRAITLDEGDEVMAVRQTDGQREVLLATRQGMAIRFSEEEVRPMGRAAAGVKGIDVEAEDAVIAAEVVQEGAAILTVTERGYGKRTELEEYRLQSRGGLGIINIQTSERNGKVIGVVQVSDDDELMLITQQGKILRMASNNIRSIGRATQGVRLIEIEGEDRAVSIARLAEREGDE